MTADERSDAVLDGHYDLDKAVELLNRLERRRNKCASCMKSVDGGSTSG
jgi:hypothetical protein